MNGFASPGRKWLPNTPPVKVKMVDLGFVHPSVGGEADTGDFYLKIDVPSCRVHMAVRILFSPDTGYGACAFTVKTWNIRPAGTDSQGAQLCRMQPEFSTDQTLPGGYEAESGVKTWVVNGTLTPADDAPTRVYAMVTWERGKSADMSEDEWTYWANLCDAGLLMGGPLNLSPPA